MTTATATWLTAADENARDIAWLYSATVDAPMLDEIDTAAIRKLAWQAGRWNDMGYTTQSRRTIAQAQAIIEEAI